MIRNLFARPTSRLTSRPTAMRRSAAGVLALLAVVAPSATTAQAQPDEGSEAIVRLLPPRQSVVSGRTLIETLLIDPEVRTVVFFVDGEQVGRAKLPPWDAKVNLASPAREQTVRVEALDGSNRVLGSDELTVNRSVTPLRVDLRAVEVAGGSLRVRGDLSVPRSVELERVVVYLNEDPVASFGAEEVGGSIEASIDYAGGDESDFVRVVAYLRDGRTIEDVELVRGAAFQEEIDVHLVQLQVLVTNKQGAPLKGLRQEHFEIRDGSRKLEPAGLFVANDVSLLLGLALDSSGSMQMLWPQTRRAAENFLDRTITPKDEGFLIDFDTELHLVEPRTGDLQKLKAGLSELEPDGGTALYDSILYSLLQFDRQQGRRGLVVLTDGFDIDSKADPKRAIEFSRRLGVPVYIVALEATARGAGLRNVRGGPGISASAGGLGASAGAIQTLHLVTDPSGGRMFRARTGEQIAHAFDQINSDLRNQYVLTYYTDDPPEPGHPPDVKVEVDGFKNLKVKVLLGADQIY